MTPPVPIGPPAAAHLRSRVLAALRWGTTTATWTYVVVLILWIAALRFVGDRHWLTGLALFLPPQGWLLPLGLLVPVQALLRPRLLLLSLGCLALVVGFHMEPRWNDSQPWLPGPAPLRLVSNNVGQRSLPSLQPFLQAQEPDVMLFQECPALDPGAYHGWLPKVYQARLGEFGLVSRYPIRAQGWVPGLGVGPGESASAAWFEVAVPGQTVVFYNVHFPTPRPLLGVLKQRHPLHTLRGWAYRLTRSGRAEASDWFARRVELHRRLRDHLATERRPFLVAGDFNLPSQGPEYRAFARIWIDAFAACGQGFGYTVPGITRNPLTLCRPWLRIDYAFGGPGWAPLTMEVEPPVPAQHRALAVQWRWTKATPPIPRSEP